MKKNKIIIVCGDLGAGGAERVISIIAPLFFRNFECVKILTYYNRRIFYDLDPRIIVNSFKYPNKDPWSVCKNIRWYRKWVEEENPTVVLSFLTPFNILVSFSMLGSSIPLIVANRNDPSFDKYPILRNFMYNFVDAITTQTVSNKNAFPFFLRKKIYVIPNPVFLKKDLVGKALSVNKKDEIVAVARLVKQKNIPFLIDSFDCLHKKYPNIVLKIFGDCVERQRLLEIIHDKQLERYIYLEGQDECLHEKILTSKIFVLVSLYEGMPNALIEAMCLGLPVVSSKVSGAVDLIKDSINGRLFNVNDKDMFIDILDELLSDSDKRISLGKESSYLYNNLDVDFIYGLWMDCINNVLSR